MSLDVYLYIDNCTCHTCGSYAKSILIYHNNITHNLGVMAKQVDENFYKALWRPDELYDNCVAQDLIETIKEGLEKLSKKFEPDNGWGCYDDLEYFAFSYLTALRKNPEARVEVSR